MSEPHDPVPGWVAALDQSKQGLPFIADFVWAIYQAFRDAGFSEDHAIRCTLQQWGYLMESESEVTDE